MAVYRADQAQVTFMTEPAAGGYVELAASTNSAGTSITRSWFDGTVETMEINVLTTEEEAIEGLHAIKCNYTCKLLGVE